MRVALLLLVVSLLCAAPRSASASVWLAEFSAGGLTQEEGGELRAQVWSELAAIGASDVGQATDAACAEREACLAERHVELGADAALVLHLLRAGPLLQISTTVIQAREAPWREERLLQTKDLEAGGALLSEALLRRLREAAAHTPEASAAAVGEEPGPPPDDDTPPAAVPLPSALQGVGAAAPTTADVGSAASSQPPPPTAGDEGGVPLLGIAGLGLAGAGLAIAAIGGAIAVGGNEVLLDPASAADEKARATVYGPAAIGAAAIGAVLAVSGAALAVVGLVPQPSTR